MWDLISRLLKHSDHLRRGLDEMIEQERAGMRGNPDEEAASCLDVALYEPAPAPSSWAEREASPLG